MSRPVPEGSGRSVQVVGRAKINLFLSVAGVRPDGYHDLEMVMQTVELADDLTIAHDSSQRTSVVFQWADGLRGGDPVRPDLVERAVEEYRGRAGGAGVRVEVLKRIPLASGMAGGSADAAAALVGIDALMGGKLASELPALAAALGSDVPFALAGGICVARGRGEQLEAVACPTRLWWVLGIAPFGIATPEVFRRYDLPRSGDADEGSLRGLIDAVAAGDPAGIAPFLHNGLAPAARDVEPRLGRLEAAMSEAGALGSVVSGSGPTVVGLCRDEDHAREIAARAAMSFARVEVVASAQVGAELVTPPPA